MAESVLLSALVAVVFDKSADLIEQQLGEVLGADVEREVGKLQSVLSTVQAVLRDAEEKQLTDESVRNWLAKLKLVAYDAEDLLEDFNEEVLRLREEGEEPMKKKVRRFFSSENPLLSRSRMARKIKEIVGRFDLLAEERDKFHLIADAGAVGRMSGTRDGRPQTHSYVPESDVIGREADVEKIVELLIGQKHEKSVSVLPIVGMGGLGKTTLAQMVYNQPRVRDHFQPRIWVCVSDNFDTAMIARAVIESVTEKKCDVSDMDPLQRSLRNALDGKRYLLVLDDVWNEDEQRWNELRVLLTFGGEGSTVIVTTRSDMVSSIVGTLATYRLAQLSDDECWNLFKRLAFATAAEAPPNLVTMGQQIVNKCGRLPLAVTILGRLMRHKREEREWRRVMESEIWDLPVGQSGILPALRLSYNHLPAHVKQCFAFCAIFPKDYQMEKELLIQLWMANGFIPSDARMELELKGQEVFDELAQRSFFQDIRKEHKRGYSVLMNVTMHDLIHDLARSIMGNECRSLGLDHNKDKLEDLSNSSIRHLSLTHGLGSSRFADLHYSKTMRTLLPLGYLSIPVPADHRYLRVLVFCNTKMNNLPISICNLRHLRYLDLSFNHNIKTLPEELCELFNLQTLKLVHCINLLKLPKGMRNMSNLRYLDLDGCTDLRCMPAGMGQLRRLRTLPLYIAGDEDGSGSIRELKNLNLQGTLELLGLGKVRIVAEAEEANLGSKENLQRLILRWDQSFPRGAENAEEVLEALRPHHGLQRLEIHRYDGVRFPTWLMGDSLLLLNLVEINLYECSRCEHLPQLGQLGFLERLVIKQMPSLKHMGGTEFYGRGAGGTVFPSLRELRLITMLNLEEWSGIEGSPLFPQLVKLQVLQCPKLTTMPRFPSVQDLKIGECPLLHPVKGFFGCMTSLESLLMDSCDKLTLMLEQEENEAGIASLQHLLIGHCHQQMFSSPALGLWKHLTSLQELSLESCDGLISLPVEAVRSFSSLGSLTISSCPNLISSSSGAGGLHLQYLTALKSLSIGHLPSLTSLLEGLGRLTALERFDVVGVPSLTSLPEGLGRLTALKTLCIRDLPSLTSLPEGLGRLTALEVFGVVDLPSLTSLPEGLGRLTALKTLRIQDLPSLTSLPEGLGRLTALEVFDVVDLPSLTSLPEGLGRLTALKTLLIQDLPSLTSLSEGLGHLTALEVFGIVDLPSLTSLPEGLGRLTALEYLRIQDLPGLTSLPEGLGRLTALNLRIQDLPGLTSLPEGLGRLTALKNLRIQDLPGLTSLPEGLGRLTGLNSLRIKDLPGLTSLPEGLGRLTALNSLRIKDLPGLTSLPEWLGRLTALKTLRIQD